MTRKLHSLKVELSQLRIVAAEFTVGNARPVDGDTRITRAGHGVEDVVFFETVCKMSVAAVQSACWHSDDWFWRIHITEYVDRSEKV